MVLGNHIRHFQELHIDVMTTMPDDHHQFTIVHGHSRQPPQCPYPPQMSPPKLCFHPPLMTPFYDLTHLTQPPLCIVLTSKDDPLPGTLNFFHPTRMTPSMYLPPRPRMTPLYDYILTPQDATPPPLSLTQDTPPPSMPSHT